MLSLTVYLPKKSWDWLYEPILGLFCIFAKCVIIFAFYRCPFCSFLASLFIAWIFGKNLGI